MGKPHPGTKVPRKKLIEALNNGSKQHSEHQRIIEQALLMNAAFHKKLQHELCACTHGASQHFSEDTHCTKVDCTCQKFVSNHDASLKNWKSMLLVELEQKHSLSIFLGTDYPAQHPLSEPFLLKGFEAGHKPEAYAKLVVDFLNKPLPPLPTVEPEVPAPRPLMPPAPDIEPSVEVKP